jgi:predicted GH43/DUF377 family glycosyl hydrolase
MFRLVAAHPKSRRASLVLLAVLAPVFLFSASSKWMQSGWKRASIEPILSPQGEGWESAGTFNPAVIRHQGKFVMLYRAQDKSGTSCLGYAESKDGLHFQRRPEPVLAPQADYEKDGGVEDPRLVKFADTFYLTYTGYNKKDAQLCLATSKGFGSLAAPTGHPARQQAPLERAMD